MMAYQIVSAYVLDLILGDPGWLFHPVRIIGKAIESLEVKLRRGKLNLRFSGIILAILITMFAYLAVSVIFYVFNSMDTRLGLAVNTFFIYTSLSVTSLGKASRGIYDSLKGNKVSEARDRLSMIVGRNTENLNEDEIIRATIETTAESTVDGIISPLFYACIGGAPLALAYKAINTLDSMVGYKNERYKELGWFSAKLDDFANWIPARVSAILIPLSAFVLRMRFRQSIKTIAKDGNKSPSPNAGIPEAGFAGALGIMLGGTNYYGGIEHKKPVIGAGNRPKEKNDILRSVRLMKIVSLSAIVLASVSLISSGGAH